MVSTHIWHAKMDGLHVLGNGLSLLLYVSLTLPRFHDLKVETKTTMLFNLSMMVLAYIDVQVEFSLVLLIIYDF